MTALGHIVSQPSFGVTCALRSLAQRRMGPGSWGCLSSLCKAPKELPIPGMLGFIFKARSCGGQARCGRTGTTKENAENFKYLSGASTLINIKHLLYLFPPAGQVFLSWQAASINLLSHWFLSAGPRLPGHTIRSLTGPGLPSSDRNCPSCRRPRGHGLT
ncbi:hypothetical protein N657DRAFT_421607 [Parathielavia appendiculata]|uniref:Uncharacterized protein n=1 Tax=Parathielavia appendiculata TaxID=2587402 RepID=A0AAN6TZL4_9PEZI|nr:hypothetical protein N657DRAFT_421607 [Parathielavia appendiculata]